MRSPFSVWPCRNLGSYKYILLGPLVADVVYRWIQEDEEKKEEENWCLFVLSLYLFRCAVYESWNCFSNMHFFKRTRRIFKEGVDFQQIDIENEWDNFLIMQTAVVSLVCCVFPSAVVSLPMLNIRGLMYCIVAHVFISEPVYYWAHRHFHSNFMFRHYHSLHHSSKVPQPFTAGNATPLEHIVLALVSWGPVVAVSVTGNGSRVLVFGYFAVFDCLRCLGHCNVEIVSHRVFEFFPLMKYLIYTPTYHSLHHKEMETNFCLFMPLFDAIWNTLNPMSWDLHKEISSNKDKYGRIPDFVFLAHIVDVTQCMHISFLLRSYAAKPFTTKLILMPLWPIALCFLLGMWILSNTFLFNFYNLRHGLYQVWVVPRVGFQYFLPFARDGINRHIEKAILRADKLGVKVVSLAALNKNEALNGGGTLFVTKHPSLNVKVVHGNTLTAAVILNNIKLDSAAGGDVFLTGATSKLGRAIALYLCRLKIRVLMLTLGTERFHRIQKEADVDHRKYLVQVTKYQAAQNCKTWIVGKWITPREQRWAPSGTHFHQFVVPPILSFRRDCIYSHLASMRLPDDVKGLGFCEYTMDRGVVHACHAGGVVHLLEGWSHHEVGAIDVDRIDLVWKAALRHGLKPVPSFR